MEKNSSESVQNVSAYMRVYTVLEFAVHNPTKPPRLDNYKPFVNQTGFNYLNTGLVCYSDPDCISIYFLDLSGVPSLIELASREVAASIPFELVERYFPPIPEELQLKIAFWSFPDQVIYQECFECTELT